MKDREIYWMDFYKSNDDKYGYNLRRDSSSQTFVHEKTKEIFRKIFLGKNNPNYGNKWTDKQRKDASIRLKEQFKNDRKIEKWVIEKSLISRKLIWEKNPELKENMKSKLSKINSTGKIYQYNKYTKQLIKVWDGIYDILKENPTYKRHNINAACNGGKPTIYGYIWIRIKEDIVRTE